MVRNYIVLTGSTGLIGEYLLKELLSNNLPVAVIGRSTHKQSLADRVNRIVERWEATLHRSLPRPVCLEGDLRKAQLGLSSDDCQWLAAHAGDVLHNAASVKFFDDGDGEPWRTNVEGTRHLIELCQRVGLQRVHYMSTAFVCGDRMGTILEEELDCGQSFGSDYERSKFTAESMLREARFEKLTVFRPCAVVGDWATGYTSTYHGFYLYVQFTYLAQQRAGARPGDPWPHPVRLFSTGDEQHCMVPVDWVAAAAAEIVRRPDLHGQTYHLAPEYKTSMREVETALQEYFGYHGVEFVGMRAQCDEPFNAVEELFYGAVSTGQHRYWDSHPTFSIANIQAALPHLPCPRVDVECMKRLIEFAVADRFGRRGSQRRKAPRSAGQNTHSSAKTLSAAVGNGA